MTDKEEIEKFYKEWYASKEELDLALEWIEIINNK